MDQNGPIQKGICSIVARSKEFGEDQNVATGGGGSACEQRLDASKKTALNKKKRGKEIYEPNVVGGTGLKSEILMEARRL